MFISTLEPLLIPRPWVGRPALYLKLQILEIAEDAIIRFCSHTLSHHHLRSKAGAKASAIKKLLRSISCKLRSSHRNEQLQCVHNHTNVQSAARDSGANTLQRMPQSPCNVKDSRLVQCQNSTKLYSARTPGTVHLHQSALHMSNLSVVV